MRKWRLIFYIFLLLVAFAPFLPVPYAPPFLHDFFSGIGSIIFIPVFMLLICWMVVFLVWSYFVGLKIKGILLEFIIVLVVFMSSTLLFSPLDDWRNRTTIWLNDGREVGNFVNPFLGMKMIDCRNVSRPYEVMFKHNGVLVEFKMLEYAPQRQIRELHNGGITKIYGGNWYLSVSGSQYSQEWANCLTDERQ